jgi:ssDNA-binding Zn-finger/Zn-ribbon topoisomerase 1
MHQIYITSAVTTLLALVIIGGFIRWRADKPDHKLLLTLFLIELPVAFIAFYLVRLPLVDSSFKFLFSFDLAVYGFMKNFYAPLTEEPAKLLPLLIPALRHKITKENFAMAAMALGLGFGIGEIWLVGNFIGQSAQYSTMPWYYFSGFINERFMVCIIHGGMTSFVLSRLNNKFIFGLLGSMCLHFIGNFPIFLAAVNFPALGKETWQVILSLWVTAFFFSMACLLVYFKMGSLQVGKFFYGNSVCPECGFNYPAPVIAINSFKTRYERCPNCRKWHWVKMWKKE